MKLITSLEKVQKYQFLEDRLAVLNLENNLFLNGKLINVEVRDFFAGKYIYYTVENKLFLYYDNQIQFKLEGNYFLSHAWESNQNLLVLKEINDTDSYFSVASNGVETKLNWDNNYVIKITNNYFLSRIKTSLSLHSLSDSTPHWQKEFSANIHQIEVWDERVVVVETVGRETNKFYSLKANTGETIWQYDAAKLKIIANKVFGVVHTHSELTLIHFNPLKEEPIFKYNITTLVFDFFKSLPFFKFTIDEAKLFISFTSLNTLMIIDLEKMLIEWHHKVETDASWIGEPKVSGNRLYVLDEANTLHIFEKEESEE